MTELYIPSQRRLTRDDILPLADYTAVRASGGARSAR